MKPETHWERRCMLNENVLDAALSIMQNILPPAGLDAVANLREQWQNQIDELDKQAYNQTKP